MIFISANIFLLKGKITGLEWFGVVSLAKAFWTAAHEYSKKIWNENNGNNEKNY